MKFVTKANTAINTGADQVVSAVATASQTLQTELSAGIAEANAVITTVTEQLSAVGTQMTQLSQPFNPQALVGPLALALTHLQSDMSAVVTLLANMGPPLVTAGQKLAGVADDAQQAVSIAASLPDRLAALRPDLVNIPVQLAALAQRVQGLPNRAVALQPRLTQFWDSLAALQQRLAALPTNPSADWLEAPAHIQTEAVGVKAGMQGDIDTVKQAIHATATDLQGDVEAIVQSISAVLEGINAQIDGVMTDVCTVFDSVMARVDDAVAALAQALTALSVQAGGYKDRTHEVALAVVAPVLLVETAIVTLAAQVEAIGQVIDGILRSVESQISRLERIIAALKQAIDDAVGGVDTAITCLNEALGELID